MSGMKLLQVDLLMITRRRPCLLGRMSNQTDDRRHIIYHSTQPSRLTTHSRRRSGRITQMRGRHRFRWHSDSFRRTHPRRREHKLLWYIKKSVNRFLFLILVFDFKSIITWFSYRWSECNCAIPSQILLLLGQTELPFIRC